MTKKGYLFVDNFGYDKKRGIFVDKKAFLCDTTFVIMS